ncbi:MAG: hypothetical protein KC729_13785, partial [Candidatus Eisenbacteria bacterium]|nr:hypothetical protein [Candidatus Eisenbacteria bacterium]
MSQSLDLDRASIESIEAALENREVLLPAEASALRDRAAELLLAEPKQAARIADLLLEHSRRSPVDHELAAIAWRCRAEASIYLGQLEAAAEGYRIAAGKAKRSGDALLHARILVGRIGVATAMGDHKQHRRWSARAESILRRHQDETYLTKLHMNLGAAEFHRERYEVAYAHYRDALAAMGDRPDDPTWIMVHNNLGVLCTETSRIPEARRHFLIAEESAEALGLDHLVAHARFDRSFLEVLLGNYRAALQLLETASEQFEKLEATDLRASCHLANAKIYLDLGMAREAIELARSAGTLFAQEGKLLDAAVADLRLAGAFLSARRFRSALDSLERAELFYRSQRIRPRVAQVLLARSEIALAHGDFAEAFRCGQDALRMFESLDLVRPRVQAQQIVAEAELGLGRVRAAA